MSRQSMGYTFIPVSTVGGAAMTVATGTGPLFGGFILNGSAGGCTLTVKDSATTLLTTSAAASALISVMQMNPIRCNPIVTTVSGTGFYSILVSK